VIRRDLIRDYREETAQLSAVRGRVVPLATARTFYRGSLKPTCVYEEFDNDNSLNRVLKAAAASVARSRLLETGLRRRAVVALAQMADVSDLRVGDLEVSPDLRTAYYRDAWKLACQVLAGQGIEMLSGETLAWTFLIRTPDLLEEGIRNLLQEALHPTWHLEKKGRQLIGAPITLNPDLVFEHGRLVGDVKYKLLSAWHQSDLYQAIAFATGYRASGALVISFLTDAQQTELPELIVGDLPVTSAAWMASTEVTPQQARGTLVEQVERWLETRLGTKSALRQITA
jgi:5-methylcytosine-specific restriction endonuclease McrBC regulatory subunit McrC